MFLNTLYGCFVVFNVNPLKYDLKKKDFLVFFIFKIYFATRTILQ